jgi:hypothetical protein
VLVYRYRVKSLAVNSTAKPARSTLYGTIATTLNGTRPAMGQEMADGI